MKSPEELKELAKIDGGIVAVVDATQIALEEKTKVNTAMLGAIFRILDFSRCRLNERYDSSYF